MFNAFGAAPAPAQSLLSTQMQSYWVNLAASGNPNGARLPIWKAYDPGADNALQLDAPIGETAQIQRAACNFWDTVQQYFWDTVQ